jgi:hypothetical protein
MEEKLSKRNFDAIMKPWEPVIRVVAFCVFCSCSAGFFYLVGSLTSWSWDIGKWSEMCRLVIGILEGFIIFFSAVTLK